MEQTNATAPQGKGMGITGFILTLVGLVFEAIVIPMGALVGMWLSYFWLVIIVVGLALSVMGMMKLGKTGGKKGLAITGLVLGLVGLIWGIMLLVGTMKAKEAVDTLKEGFENVDWQKAADDMNKNLEENMNNMENTTDSTATAE